MRRLSLKKSQTMTITTNTMNSFIENKFTLKSIGLLAASVLFLLFFSAQAAFAASLSLSPGTGVYQANGTFSVRVLVNTQGQPVNAAEGTISFNPRELSVVSVSRSSSIFNLWVTEPTYSNSAGTISFSGGLPSGYTGSAGNIMNITFRAAGAGTAKVSFSNGSVLANDGRGTNILTAMNGGNYTIQAASAAPTPEVIEYVAPANTPAAPKVASETHPDPSKWYSANEAKLSWSLPSDVTSVRTLLDENSGSIPTKVYDNPISSITLPDLDEGVSYFHIQLRNADGWGSVTHYRLGVDTQTPSSINIQPVEGSDFSNPILTLKVNVEDESSTVDRFKIKIDADEPYEFIDETGSSTIELPSLEPGYHTVIIEAFDQAGNSIVGTYSFTIESFDRPVFTDYPEQMTAGVIPVIKGKTRPNSVVDVFLNRTGTEPVQYILDADEAGVFTFIPESAFDTGVYELQAQATDQYGARSELSEKVRIAVQQPGYIQIGSMIVSALSVFVPLLLLIVALILGVWYLYLYFMRFRRRVRVESVEALEILHTEFSHLQSTLRDQEALMQESRKTKKLTKAEATMIEEFDKALQSSQRRVEKEIQDVTDLTEKK